MTYTVATMEVAPATYDEIRAKLEQAGYQHAIDDNGMLDMTHIGLVRDPTGPQAPAAERVQIVPPRKLTAVDFIVESIYHCASIKAPTFSTAGGLPAEDRWWDAIQEAFDAGREYQRGHSDGSKP